MDVFIHLTTADFLKKKKKKKKKKEKGHPLVFISKKLYIGLVGELFPLHTN